MALPDGIAIFKMSESEASEYGQGLEIWAQF